MVQVHTSSLILCTVFCIRCKRLSGVIKSPQNGNMHTIQMRPNAMQIIAMQRKNNQYEPFWVIAKVMHNFINASCLCVCLVTVRLLLNVSYVILLRFTTSIIALLIRFNLPCLLLMHWPSFYGSSPWLIVALVIFSRIHSTISTEMRQKRAVNIPPSTHTSICTM